jgi:hypothetical protein
MSRRGDKHTPIVVDAPHVPPAQAGPRDAESRAVASHPAFQALIDEGRRNRAAGKGLSAAEVFDVPDAEAVVDPPPHAASPNGRPARESSERPRRRAASR